MPMAAAPLSPPLRWRCCCHSWVDPMEEEGLLYTHERELPIQMDLENRNRDDKAIGSTKEMPITDKMRNCGDESTIGLQLGIRREAGKFKERDGDLSMRTAESRLLDICAANCWSPPTFILSEEEGPDHQRRFTCKVTITVESVTATIIDCFSEAKLQEQAAEEHAAEAALWILKHLGHL